MTGQARPRVINYNYNAPVTINNYYAKGKECPKCGEYKPASGFYKRTKSKDGLQSKCIDCNRSYQKKWMNDNVYKDKTSAKYEMHLMRNSLARGNSYSYISEHLGCSPQFFKDWLEYQRNLSPELLSPIEKEEKDHVLPIKEFGDYPDLCSWWVNIRPVSQSINREKGAKVDWSLFKKQLDRSISFLKAKCYGDTDTDTYTNWFKVVDKYFDGDPFADEFTLQRQFNKWEANYTEIRWLFHG